MPDGILVLDKPSGPTSHDMVNLVRRGTGERRVGHAGTLDPMATGVLVLCLGAATRLSEFLLGGDKCYRATARFGESTTTYDAEGETISTSAVTMSRADIEGALDSLRGEIQQVPPAYSAIKRGGRKSYEAARRGEAIALEPRRVTIHDLRLEDWASPDAVLFIRCSSGTYIRSLAHDLGQALGCGAHLAALRRLFVEHFDLSQAVTVDDLRPAFADGAWLRYLLPMEAALPGWPAIQVGEAGAARIRQGLPVPASSDAAARADKGVARAHGPDGRMIAVVEIDVAAGMWRPRKVFK
ncbi:MAG: tRNA pseudouridine(55) synthase TruB [Chloroflexi bacterium]|nr:tRNA pseudouridine(55) synthase TruB [Chloroflexota bacterium]